METIIRSNTAAQAAHSSGKSKASQIAFWNKIEFSRFGIISMLVIIIGCIGGIAAAFGANGSIAQLAMVAFPTIISLALVLAVAPMRVILFVSSLAVILDPVVLIF